MKKLSALLFFTFIILISTTLYSQHDKQSIAQRTQTSDMVIEGKVIAQNSFWDDEHKRIFTNNVIEVFKIFKGSDIDTISLITHGGTVNNQFQIIPHALELSLLEEGLFFCKLYNTPNFSSEKLMVNGGNGFVKYYFAANDFRAADQAHTYSNIQNELYDVIQAHSGANYVFKKNNEYETIIENWLQETLTFSSLTDTLLEFSFENISLIGTEKVQFDIMAKSNIADVRFGSSDVYISYSIDAFGSSLVANEGIEAEKETVIENDVYTLELADEATNIVRFLVHSGLEPNELYPLSQTAQKFLRIRIKIQNIIQLASLSFDDFLMDNQSFFYNEATGTFITFDQIRIDEPIFPFLIPIIDTIYPDIITVGTGEILTIEGVMFGDVKGKVKFNSAEATGLAMIEANDTDVTWSDTNITVRMPSFPTAGSGAVVITTDDNMTDTSDILLVKYGVLNTRQLTNQQAHRVHLTGGTFDNIFFFYEDTITEIQTTSPIIDIIELAIKKWQCNTGVKWSLLGQSNFHTADMADGTNLIYMADESEFTGDFEDLIAYNVLSGYIEQCNGSVKYYVSDMDIAIRETENWWYDTTAVNSIVPDSVRDFQSLILHELGHTHKLTHVREGFKVMYPEFDLGESRREFSPFDIEGGLDVINSSQNLIGDCIISTGENILPIGQEFPTDCAGLNPVEEVSSLNHFLIYPTVFQDQLAIDLELNTAAEITTRMFDLLGREIYIKDFGRISVGKHTIILQTNQIQTKGVYFIQTEINNQTITRRVLKL